MRHGQHLQSLRTWHLHAIPRPPVDGVSPAPAGAQGRLRTLDPVAQLLVSLLSAAVGPNLEGADSHPQSQSICLTVLNENWVISKLPVRPSRALSVQQICCSHPSLASHCGFPRRDSRVAKNCVFPAPQLRHFGTLSPLPSSHLPTLVSPQKHTHAHTPESRFHTAHLSLQAVAFPVLHQLPGSAGRSPQDHRFSSPHPELWLGYLL